MALFPERGPRVADIVKERPEEPEIPESLPEVQKIETNFKANVKDGGQNLIQTPANQTVTITIPSSQSNLIAWSKGSITNSITWLARFWLRMIQKAAHFGWTVIWGGQNANK